MRYLHTMARVKGLEAVWLNFKQILQQFRRATLPHEILGTPYSGPQYLRSDLAQNIGWL